MSEILLAADNPNYKGDPTKPYYSQVGAHWGRNAQSRATWLVTMGHRPGPVWRYDTTKSDFVNKALWRRWLGTPDHL